MPQVSVNDIIGKTLYPKFNRNYYEVFDVNNLGNNAKPVGQIKVGQGFRVDSYLEPTAGYTKYGIKYAKRDVLYFTFYGAGNKYYAVKWNPDAFSFKKLSAQGVKSVEQKVEEQQESEKSFGDKLSEQFGDVGKILKNVLYIGLGVWAIGYLVPKIKK